MPYSSFERMNKKHSSRISWLWISITPAAAPPSKTATTSVEENREGIMVIFPCPRSSQASFMSLESRHDQHAHTTPPPPHPLILAPPPFPTSSEQLAGVRGTGWWRLDGWWSGTLLSYASVLSRKRLGSEREREDRDDDVGNRNDMRVGGGGR